MSFAYGHIPFSFFFHYLIFPHLSDYQARLWDTRKLEANSPLASLAHGRVVNSGYFSPQSGNKILTTCQDNRIRVWDYIFGDLESPSREIVHSHDFNRHLTPFKAEWDPKVSVITKTSLYFEFYYYLARSVP